MIDDRIKESLRIPRTAGEHAVVGAPVIKLSPDGTNSCGGCVPWRREQESVGERADSDCSTFLGEDFVPIAQ